MIKRILVVLATLVTTNLIQAQNNDYVLFYESFDTNKGTGGNDNRWNGSIASSNIQSDHEGWIFQNGKGANQCARFGLESGRGIAKTPKIIHTGNVILTFKAGAWNINNEKNGLIISTSDSTFCDTVNLQKGAWTTFTIAIKGFSSTSRIIFTAQETSNNRFFLDEVKVVADVREHEISAAKYSTYFNPDDAYIMPEDCEGMTVTFDEANKIFCLNSSYKSGDVVPAGEPLVIHSQNTGWKKLAITVTSKEPVANLLKGSNGTNPTQDEDKNAHYYYALSLNSDGDMESVGFYWIEEEGAPFEIGSGKAYLKLPKSIFTSEEQVKGLAFSEMADGVGSIRHQENNGHIYNLSGQSILKSISGHIYIRNGKRFIAK